MLQLINSHPVAWPHAPTHKLGIAGTYFVTTGTCHKIHYLKGAERLTVMHRGLLSVAHEFNWQLEAWAVFSNHSPEDDNTAESLSRMLAKLHSNTARWVNKFDHCEGRQVWHNFRDTRLTLGKCGDRSPHSFMGAVITAVAMTQPRRASLPSLILMNVNDCS